MTVPYSDYFPLDALRNYKMRAIAYTIRFIQNSNQFFSFRLLRNCFIAELSEPLSDHEEWDLTVRFCLFIRDKLIEWKRIGAICPFTNRSYQIMDKTKIK